jgi:hypothetical protein
LKEKEMIEDAPIEAPSRDHPEGSVDLEVVKIASENLTTPMVWVLQKLSLV